MKHKGVCTEGVNRRVWIEGSPPSFLTALKVLGERQYQLTSQTYRVLLREKSAADQSASMHPFWPYELFNPPAHDWLNSTNPILYQSHSIKLT